MNGHKVVHKYLKEYGYLYFIANVSNKKESIANATIRIHSHNINNIPIYATKVNNNSSLTN